MDHPKIQVDSDGGLLLNFGDYGQEVEVAAISGDLRRILTVHEVGTARIWDVESGDCLAQISPESPLAGAQDKAPMAGAFQVFIEAAALSEDGTYALLGLNDGRAVVHRVADGERVSELYPPGTEPAAEWGVIRAVCYAGERDLALVGFPGRSVGVWSTDGSEAVAFLTAASPQRLVGQPFVRDTLVSSVALSADGREVFAGAVDMTAVVFDLESGEALVEATEHAEQIIKINDSAAGLLWATTGGSVWRAGAGGAAQRCLDTGEHWSEVALSDQELIARSYRGAITRWSLDGRRETLHEPPEETVQMWADDASTLAFVDGSVHYPESGKLLKIARDDEMVSIERDAQLVTVQMSPRGDLLATEGWKDLVELWDPQSGDLIHSLPCPGGTGAIAFSPDGALLAVSEIGHGGGLYARRIYVYDTATGGCRMKLRGHRWQIRQVLFCPEGRHLASVGDELLVWDLEASGWFGRRPVIRRGIDRVNGGVAYAGAELLIVEEGRASVLSDGHERLAFQVPVGFRTPWTLNEAGTHLCVGGTQEVYRYSLDTGQLDAHVAAEIPQPAEFPPRQLRVQREIRGGAMRWTTQRGEFLHQSDGPRGWVEPLRISPEGFVAIPSSGGAVIVRATLDGAEVVGEMPFEGKLRAGRAAHGTALLVNEEGRVFKAPVPEGRAGAAS